MYIGKSENMLRRVAEHYVGIQKETEKKYRILSEARRKGHPITFDVLYDAKQKRDDDITEEIGQKEGEYIREYMPCLNLHPLPQDARIPSQDGYGSRSSCETRLLSMQPRRL